MLFEFTVNLELFIAAAKRIAAQGIPTSNSAW